MKKKYELPNPLRVAVYSRCGVPLPEVQRYTQEQELLAVCRAGQVDHLLVERFASLGRNAIESLHLLRELQAAGVKVSALKEGWVC